MSVLLHKKAQLLSEMTRRVLEHCLKSVLTRGAGQFENAGMRTLHLIQF